MVRLVGKKAEVKKLITWSCAIIGDVITNVVKRHNPDPIRRIVDPFLGEESELREQPRVLRCGEVVAWHELVHRGRIIAEVLLEYFREDNPEVREEEITF